MTKKDLWENMLYIYDLMFKERNFEDKDEYMTSYINYCELGGNKGYTKGTQHITIMYYTLLNVCDLENERRYTDKYYNKTLVEWNEFEQIYKKFENAVNNKTLTFV